MKLKKKSNKKIYAVATGVVVTLALFGVALFIYLNKGDDSKSQQSTETTQSENNEQTELPTSPKTTGQGTTPPPSDSEEAVKKSNPVADEPTTPTPPETKLSITRLEQRDSNINLDAKISGNPNGGRCIAYFTSAGAGSVSEYMTLSGSSCSLQVSELKFSYLGKWSVRVTYTTPDNTITEARKDIVVR